MSRHQVRSVANGAVVETNSRVVDAFCNFSWLSPHRLVLVRANIVARVDALTIFDFEVRSALTRVLVALVALLRTANVVVELEANGFRRRQLAKSVERHRRGSTTHQFSRKLLRRAVSSRAVLGQRNENSVVDRFVFNSCKSKLVG